MLPFHLKGQNSGWVCMPHTIRGAGGGHAHFIVKSGPKMEKIEIEHRNLDFL